MGADMNTFLLPALLILCTVLGWMAIRNRGVLIRIAGSVAALAGLTLILSDAGVSPILAGASVPEGPQGHWLRCVGVLWWIIAARIAAASGRLLLERNALSREARITADLLSGLIYLATLLVVLDFVLLLPVGGLVATSGVVAVVIGLALQNTLADVFSGIAVGIERPFGPGDRITLTDGIEGIVIEINWRSVRIQTDGEDIATIPNSVIAKAQILNRSVPKTRRSAHVSVTCPVEVRPELALELLHRAAMLSPSILSTPAPFTSMTRLGVRTNTFAIDYFVADTAMVASSRTTLLSQFHRQLRYAGVVPSGGPQGLDEAAGFSITQELPIFACLSDEHRAALSSRLRRRRMRQGELIFDKGGDPDHLIVVAAGVIDILGTPADHPSEPLRKAGPGEAIGDIGLIAGEAHPFTARAASDGLLYTLSRDDLLALIREDEHLGAALERSASAHASSLQPQTMDRASRNENMPLLLGALRRLHKIFPNGTPPEPETRGV